MCLIINNIILFTKVPKLVGILQSIAYTVFVLILALLSECSPTAQIVTVVELGELQDIEN